MKAFGNATIWGPIPWLALPAALVVAGMWRLLYRQRVGRYILAVGGNASAAELSGVSISRTVLWAHAISGFLAALAGVMLVARLQLGQPSIGDDWLILSFAAPVIGGAALGGGHVSVFGTFFGVVIVAIITQALVIFRIDPFFVQVVLGLLILWAVGVNRLREVRFAGSVNDGGRQPRSARGLQNVSRRAGAAGRRDLAARRRQFTPCSAKTARASRR